MGKSKHPKRGTTKISTKRTNKNIYKEEKKIQNSKQRKEKENGRAITQEERWQPSQKKKKGLESTLGY